MIWAGFLFWVFFTCMGHVGLIVRQDLGAQRIQTQPGTNGVLVYDCAVVAGSCFYGQV